MKNKNRIMILTWDTENGSATYRLPYENAIEIITEILPRVPSITIYDNDQRNNLRNYYRNHGPHNDDLRPNSPKDKVKSNRPPQ